MATYTTNINTKPIDKNLAIYQLRCSIYVALPRIVKYQIDLSKL